MKQTYIVFFAAMATSSLCAEQTCLLEADTKCVNCKPPRDQKLTNADETGKVVIANFLAMFAHFLNLATAEKGDKVAFVANSLGIAQGIANIATEACKCVELHGTDPEDILDYIEAQCEQAHVDAHLTKQLTRAIKQQYWKSALLLQETRGRYAEYVEHSDTLID